MAKHPTSSSQVKGVARPVTDVAIEALVILSLVLVPLAFRGRETVAFFSQPKFFVLHFVALSIVVIWLLEIALRLAAAPPGSRQSTFVQIDSWLAEHRHRWAVAAAAGFAFVLFISVLLSPQPWVSVWGRDFGDLGYELYSSLSYLVIFFAIALRIRTREQILRIVWALAAVGTISAIYGVSQAFGHDPIGRVGVNTRVIATYGNPLFLGSFIVITAPMVVGLSLQQDAIGRRWMLAVGAVALGLHIAAAHFAGGRGPLIGGTVGIVSLVVVGLIWLERERAIKMSAVVAMGIVVAIIIGSIPGGRIPPGRGLDQFKHVLPEFSKGIQFVFGGDDVAPVSTGPISALPTASPDPTPTETPTSDPSGAVIPTVPPDFSQPDIVETEPPPPDGRSSPSTLAQASAIGTYGVYDPDTYALGNRASIWRGALDLLQSRDSPDAESGLQQGLRHLFGYGPDMYFYSYPLAARPQPTLEGNSHAHNYLLQVWLEQGIVGLALITATGLIILITAVSVLRRAASRAGGDAWLPMMMVGIIAALTGRVIEQGSGVGRVSDLLAFWAVMGLVIAIAEIDEGAKSSGNSGTPVLSRPKFDFKGLAPFGGVAIAVLVAFLVFIPKDVQTLRAGWIAANGFESKAMGNSNKAFLQFEEASELAPDVERYILEVSRLISTTAANTADLDTRAALFNVSREVLLEYERRDRLAWQTQLALSSLSFAQFSGGDESLRQEVLSRNLKLASLMGPYSTIQADVAVRLVSMGEYQLGALIAQESIRLEPNSTPVPGAWWALGESLFQLDQVDEAEIAWETAIQRGLYTIHAARAHKGLAFIAELRGDADLAKEHHRHAREKGA